MNQRKLRRCLIEGCSRSTGRDVGSRWICGPHWRIGCPPGSPERRTYNRFFRIARKHGWSDQLLDRFWRFWAALEKRAQRRCAGDVDVAEINKMFGWDA
jgi:hypothetical protein